MDYHEFENASFFNHLEKNYTALQRPIFFEKPTLRPASKPMHRFMPRRTIHNRDLWKKKKRDFSKLPGPENVAFPAISMGFRWGQCCWSRRFGAQFCQRNPSKTLYNVKVEKNPWPPKQQRKSKTGWWYTYPSEKYEFVSWDDGIPNWMESHNPFMFQTTNQLIYPLKRMIFQPENIKKN